MASRVPVFLATNEHGEALLASTSSHSSDHEMNCDDAAAAGEVQVAHPEEEDRLLPPRRLSDPHKRCITPPRPTCSESPSTAGLLQDAPASSSTSSCGPSASSSTNHFVPPISSYLRPGTCFVGRQYFAKRKSDPAKQPPPGSASANGSSSGSSYQARDSTTLPRARRLVEDLTPEIFRALSLPERQPRRPPATTTGSSNSHAPPRPSVRRQPEEEVQADSDTEHQQQHPLDHPSGLSDSTINIHRGGMLSEAYEDMMQSSTDELLNNIRRLRDVTRQTAHQLRNNFDQSSLEPGGTRAFEQGCRSLFKDQQWDVRVCIQSIDWEAGTLRGLMDACNVPTDGAVKTVSTLFHGDILDGHNHSIFRRPEHHWSAETAAAFRRTDQKNLADLKPFEGMSPEAIKDSSYNTSEWLLMRWKEDGFLDSLQMSQSSFTIHGYYLLALSRRTGAIEGLYLDYMDADTCPQQNISLAIDKAPESAAPWTPAFTIV